MKTSDFNTIIKKDDGSLLLFNSITNAILSVEPRNSNRVLNILNSKEENIFPHLKDGGFLINEDDDELNKIRTKYLKYQFSKDFFRLTITMSTYCNFKCSYCYQSQAEKVSGKIFKKRNIKYDLIYKIIGLVEKKLINEKPKLFSVTFWGGEPLLEKEKIYYISNKFKNICDELNIKYESFFVSNGYLLDKETANNLKKSGVNLAIVTLDGLKNTHNKFRRLNNNKGTFDVIYKNVKESSNILPIKIRMNVLKSNLESIKRLIDLFSKDNLNVDFDFRQLEISKELRNENISLKEFSELEVELIEYMISKFPDYNYNPFSKINKARCDAGCQNSVVIDTDGKLYKCWGEIGGMSKEVGEIDQIGNLQFNHRLNNWLSLNPIKKECENCKILPYCMGGCVLGEIMKNDYKIISEEKERCLSLKYNLKEILLLVEKNQMRRKRR